MRCYGAVSEGSRSRGDASVFVCRFLTAFAVCFPFQMEIFSTCMLHRLSMRLFILKSGKALTRNGVLLPVDRPALPSRVSHKMKELNWAKLFGHGGQVRLRVAGVRRGLENGPSPPLAESISDSYYILLHCLANFVLFYSSPCICISF